MTNHIYVIESKDPYWKKWYVNVHFSFEKKKHAQRALKEIQESNKRNGYATETRVAKYTREEAR